MYEFDKDSVKQLNKVHRIIGFVVSIPMFFLFFYFDNPFGPRCKKDNRYYYDLELSGMVDKKIPHSMHHNLPLFEFSNGGRVASEFLRDKYEKIGIGDSILKKSKSYDFYIIKKDTAYKFSLYKNCDSLK
jgi:hypothetical protein